MKRRLLTFGLLGPISGYLVFLALSGDHAALVGRSVGLVMPLVFAVETVPFLICAIVDFFLENVRWWERVAVALVLGFLLTFFAVFALLPAATSTDWRLLPLGFVGAIPAAICSWLIRRMSLEVEASSQRLLFLFLSIVATLPAATSKDATASVLTLYPVQASILESSVDPMR